MKLKTFLPAAGMTVIFLWGCEKKYERPDRYAIDLFATEAAEEIPVLSADEAAERSDLILRTNMLLLADSASAAAKKLYVYEVQQGRFSKGNNDSTAVWPFRFISDYEIRKPAHDDSASIYLQKASSYTIITNALNIRFQAVPYAP
ncbi:hypothetical protein [Chryseobacterium sp. MFBS3-17]|uniref:hypothetical protein n=1 Tax=Chryseobacterium sp. MFBS3-17 TaxID=2886689 RepID=UPI001D0E7164|nr:hypothetical protein [Chryseobacterium sp. MFBS3-17]MCC2590640.1 hypothetical protein [Chryseobacterium sp. MFBS3-17]